MHTPGSYFPTLPGVSSSRDLQREVSTCELHKQDGSAAYLVVKESATSLRRETKNSGNRGGGIYPFGRSDSS